MKFNTISEILFLSFVATSTATKPLKKADDGIAICSNQATCEILYTDDASSYGVENDEWCHCNDSTVDNYPICTNPKCKIIVVDSDGKFDVENNNWCHCNNENSNTTTTTKAKATPTNSTRKAADGLAICSNQATCEILYTDDASSYGVENDEWCHCNDSTVDNYPICTNPKCKIIVVDSNGKFDVENNNWCHCNNENSNTTTTTKAKVTPTNSTRKAADGLAICSNQATCEILYTGDDGSFSVENDEWCHCNDSTVDGYPVCTDPNCKVLTIDQDGRMGVEKNGWCHCNSEIEMVNNFPVCKDPNCVILDFDKDGGYAVENDEWCFCRNVKSTTTTTTTTTNNNKPTSTSKIAADGYPVCSDNVNCKVLFFDDDGSFSVENDEWCHCNDGVLDGYPVCKNKTCDVIYIDESGKWGVEDDRFCHCNNVFSSNTTKTTTTTTKKATPTSELKKAADGINICSDASKCIIVHSDEGGDFAIENDDWCHCNDSAIDSDPMCSKNCKVVYADASGKMGVENNAWCHCQN